MVTSPRHRSRSVALGRFCSTDCDRCSTWALPHPGDCSPKSAPLPLHGPYLRHMESALFSTLVEPEEAGPVLKLRGEADLSVVDVLSSALTSYLADIGANEPIIDCGALRYLDSTCLGVLLLARQGRANPLVLRSPQHAVRRLLETGGVEGMFEVRG